MDDYYSRELVPHRCEEPTCKYIGVMNHKDTWVCNFSDGIVRYSRQTSISPATWDEWFEKWAVMLDGTALTEANKLYKKDKNV